MIWMDFNIESFPDGSFAVKGEWPGEVMGIAKDGTKKDHYLYKPGDVFVVNEYGILRKTDEVNALLLKHQTNKD
jgi:hypothetical protein